MSYLAKRKMIARQLEMFRSGMRTGTSENGHMVDDTSNSIADLEKADAEYVSALDILKQVDQGLGEGLEALTLQPTSAAASREVHWYHLWRQTPKHSPPEKDDWSVPGELSPEAALAYFEKHEGFVEGLTLCDDPADLSAEFILEKRELLRTPRGNSVGLRAGRLVDSHAVRRGRALRRNNPGGPPLPFPPIRLNRLAPGSNGGLRSLPSVQAACIYVNEYVPSSKHSELWWRLAIVALNHASRTGEGFSHARAALAEALRSEGWMGD